ncbi:Glycerol-3-phosphate acyltransferase 3 [Nymphon striatum]|nr:Glycerol-3-phosphate acyltransferase 3 [Nymphon striatum]
MPDETRYTLLQCQVQNLTETITEIGNPYRDDFKELVALDTHNCADASVITTVNTIEEVGTLQALLTFVGVAWLVICTAIIGYLPKNKENRAKPGGICVANHTSPIDVVILACDNCYALVGQSHEGFLEIIQRALGKATNHVWFERSEVRDRTAVARRLKMHVEDKENLPILIFPEGTCINNTSVMMFKKGSFEVGGIIYPVAIKYDPKFGDAFWNSSQQGMIHYLLRMMTSWAIVCDVWYLPPMVIGEGEDAITFANRVKAEIAREGGLVDLMWDGQLKRVSPKPDMRKRQQEEFSKRIKFD